MFGKEVWLYYKPVFPNQGSQEPWGSSRNRGIYVENTADLYIKFS
jgi:hypothetical protein